MSTDQDTVPTQAKGIWDELCKDNVELTNKLDEYTYDVINAVLGVPGVPEAILAHVYKTGIELEGKPDFVEVAFYYCWEAAFDFDIRGVE